MAKDTATPVVATPVSNPEKTVSAKTNPAAPLPVTLDSLMAQADEYLTSRGWERQGAGEKGEGLWADPHGSLGRGHPTHAIKLPEPGGGEATIYQTVLPPVPWTYVTSEALAVQRTRDAHGTEHGTPLSRLHRLETRYEEMAVEVERLKGVVDKLLVRQLPTKDPGLTQELAYTRGVLRDVSATLEKALRRVAG